MTVNIPPEFVEHLGLPDEEIMGCVDGLVENHQYMDRRDTTLEAVNEALRVDAVIPELGPDDDFYDELEKAGLEGFVETNLYGDLDSGVRAAVLTIAYAGAVPYTSCSAAPGHRESVPLVAFWAEAPAAARILSAAAAAGVDVTPAGQCCDYPGGLMLSVESHAQLGRMRAFAEALLAATVK